MEPLSDETSVNSNIMNTFPESLPLNASLPNIMETGDSRVHLAEPLEQANLNPHSVLVDLRQHRLQQNEGLSQGANAREMYQWLQLIWPPTRQLTIEEGFQLSVSRLSHLGMELSTSQLRTTADGNCAMHALVDQIR